MSKENINGFDFTQDFSEEEIYEILKSGVLSACKDFYGEEIAEADVLIHFDRDFMFYEVNSKFYPSIKFDLEINVCQRWRKRQMVVTPFNVYCKIYGDQMDLLKDRHKLLTKIHRDNMVAQYGDVYKRACKDFIQEIKDARNDMAKDLYNQRIDYIEKNYNEDMNIVEL